LAIDGIPGDTGTQGYMDDGSDSYKRFFVDANSKLVILAKYPKSNFANEYVFREVIRKFDPDVFFIKEPVEVDHMDLATLSDIYWNSYPE
jgi:hypothetical protein